MAPTSTTMSLVSISAGLRVRTILVSVGVSEAIVRSTNQTFELGKKLQQIAGQSLVAVERAVVSRDGLDCVVKSLRSGLRGSHRCDLADLHGGESGTGTLKLGIDRDA